MFIEYFDIFRMNPFKINIKKIRSKIIIEYGLVVSKHIYQ